MPSKLMLKITIVIVIFNQITLEHAIRTTLATYRKAYNSWDVVGFDCFKAGAIDVSSHIYLLFPLYIYVCVYIYFKMNR